MAVDINRLSARYEELRLERSGWIDAWRQLAELFFPCSFRLDTETSAHRQPLLNSRLVNSAGVLAMRTLAAGMQGGMTSPVRPWFRLVVRGANPQNQPDGLNTWLDDATRAMQAVLHQSNFYNAIHGLYAELGTFGTGLLVETADVDGVHFSLVRAGEYVLDINGNNQVDTFFRRLHLTTRQIRNLWGGTGRVPEWIMNRRPGTDGLNQRHDVIHAVYPRTDREPGKTLGHDSKPFVSVYFLPGGGGGTGKAAVLDEGGYDMFPAFAPRWDVMGSDVYGRSPAMDVLPDCRMLQVMTATLREMQHKIADPPLVADNSIRQFGVKLSPGGLTYANLQSGITPVSPIQTPDASSLQYSMQAVQEVQKIVDDGLYTDLFRMLIDDDRRQITATEIQAKQQEKMILIGPVVERLHKELLEPLILRTYGIMREWGALPPVPDGVNAVDIDVTFESVLAQAQKMSATSAIEQGFSFAVNAAQADQTALDIIDTDEMIRSYMDRIGMPSSCLRDDDTISQIRQQRAQQQAQAQQMAQEQAAVQQLGDVSQAAKNLGQAPTGPDGQTALGAILGGMGGL